MQKEAAGRAVRRREGADFIRNRHFGSEFLRLVVGARHQRDAGDSGRKAEVIFDPRRSAGLAAERTAVQDKNGEALRCCVNRGRKSGRPGADDGNIVEAIRIDCPHQPEAARQLILAGIAQQLPTRTEHDGQLSRIDMKTLDKGLRLAVGFRIEQLERVTVATQKPLQAKHVAVFRAADNDRAAPASLQETHAAKDQCAHDPLAELGFGDQQCA